MNTPAMNARLLSLALLLCLPFAAAAAGIGISNAYTYETPAPGVAAGGFLSLSNPGKTADRLLKVESPVARSVEIHQMRMAGGVMRMRALAGGLPLPAGKTVTLAPGGLHLMLFGPARALVPGESLPLVLTFEKAGRVSASLRVRAREDESEGDAHAHH